MKATFSFNMDNEDDAFDFRTMCDASKYRLILSDLDEYLRDLVKYNSEGKSEDKIEAYQEIRDWLTEACLDENISIDY